MHTYRAADAAFSLLGIATIGAGTGAVIGAASNADPETAAFDPNYVTVPAAIVGGGFGLVRSVATMTDASDAVLQAGRSPRLAVGAGVGSLVAGAALLAGTAVGVGMLIHD